ncbi:hypothetical protein B9Z55_018308 [Caenorhabditis nigoni]|nr:hypothetical protein B9Z55_018308 [Caenorhabditis nigoni]
MSVITHSLCSVRKVPPRGVQFERWQRPSESDLHQLLKTGEVDPFQTICKMSQALSSRQPSFVNGSKSHSKVKNWVDSYPVFFRTTICFAM